MNTTTHGAPLDRIEIDPNIRVRGQYTLVGFEDVTHLHLQVGQSVEVFESESGLEGLAKVAQIDFEKELIYLDVDWANMTLKLQRGVA